MKIKYSFIHQPLSRFNHFNCIEVNANFVEIDYFRSVCVFALKVTFLNNRSGKPTNEPNFSII